jgi:spore protease
MEMDNFMPRTDLAIEARDLARHSTGSEIPGVETVTEQYDGVAVTRLSITSDEAQQKVGKLKGEYVTIESEDLRGRDREKHRNISQIFSRELRDMMRIPTDSVVLVVGLGNWNATPDALGPRVVHHLMVTRHLFKVSPPELHDGLRPVCALAPGVLGTTGMETAEIIQGVVSKVQPSMVVVVDALASMSTKRVNTTIQIGNTGIQPGSGVGNRRYGISKDTIGVPVLAVGVPTVVDAITIAADAMDIMSQVGEGEGTQAGSNSGDGVQGSPMLGQTSPMHAVNMGKQAAPHRRGGADNHPGSGLGASAQRGIIRQVLTPYIGGLIVTPRDIDVVIEDVARVLAGGLNAALHPGIDLEDVETYLQ